MKKLFTDIFLYGVVHLGTAGISFLMLPLYTNYFSPDRFGLWDVMFTTITLLIPIIACELSMAVYRWLLDEDSKEKQRKMIATGFHQLLRQLLLFTVLAVGINLIITFPFQWHALIVIDVMILSGFMQQVARGMMRNQLFAFLGFLQAVIVAAVNLIGIYLLQSGIEIFFYGYIIANFIMIIVAWQQLRFNQFISPTLFSKPLLSSYFAYALPIIPAAISWSLMSLSDRLLIAAFLGTGANGIYAISLKITAVLMMANTIFSLAWKDSAIRWYHHKNQQEIYTKVFRQYFRIMATGAILLTVMAKPLIDIFIGEAYADAWKYTGLLLTATVFHACGLFWSAGFHGAKKTKVIFTTTLIGALLNIVINIVLIPFLGLYAAALSSLIAFLVTWLLRVRKARKIFIINVFYKEIFTFILLMGFTLWYQW